MQVVRSSRQRRRSRWITEGVEGHSIPSVDDVGMYMCVHCVYIDAGACTRTYRHRNRA